MGATGGQGIGDASGEHGRLARSGPGDDEQRGSRVDHGLALSGVEPSEEFGRSGVGAGGMVGVFSCSSHVAPNDTVRLGHDTIGPSTARSHP